MKILIFAESFSNPTETFIYNQVVSLAKEHQVFVVCINRLNEATFPFSNVLSIPFQQSFFSKKSKGLLARMNLSLKFKNPAFAKKLNEFIAHFSPDIIHCHFGIQALYLVDNIVRKDLPIFITFHGYDASKKIQESVIYRKRLQLILQQKNIYALFVAHSLLDNLLKHDIHPHYAKILHLGVDTAFFSRQSHSQKAPYTFLQVSSFTEKKGHEYTLKAFQLFLKKEKTFKGKLVLAGDGILLPAIQRLAKSLALDDYVEFPGLVNREEVKSLMEMAHVFLHHSVTAKDGNTEGLPTVMMEAMAMELPILSTYHAGIPELVEHGINGYLVAERDILDYANKMSESLKWTYSTKNRTKVIKHFDSNVYLGALIDLFQTTLK